MTMRLHDWIQPISAFLRPDDTMEEAARIMLDSGLDVLAVRDASGRILGGFSSSSLYQMIVENVSFTAPIRNYIKTDAVTARMDKLSEMTLEQLEQMVSHGPEGYRVVVDEHQRIIGMLTKARMARALLESRKQSISCQHDDISRLPERNALKHPFQAMYSWDHIITSDKRMKHCIALAAKTARHHTPLLLRGESGTGKELFAHAVHQESDRAHGPFITVNCASIPEHLLEAEFLGYESGAFTGADRAGRIGKLELARGGTLFLDEIGDMPLALQAKLLRVLEGKDFFRVGGSRPIHTDVRIIAATHAPLEEMMAAKTFRADLYYRLHIMTLTIPPLRQRRSDILLLANAFIRQLNPVLNTRVTGIEDAAQEVLYQYDWPGNIRQLRNVMERGMILAEEGELSFADLPEEIAQTAARTGGDVVHAAEKREIERTLRETNGNKTKAARLLGISRSAFYEKLKKYRM